MMNGVHRFRFYFLFLSLITVALHAAAQNEAVVSIIKIDLSDKKQAIRNFGASDAWVCQYIGNWPDEKRAKVAQWLFSKKVDSSGKPLGIGLSLWRFNIGAGSASQDNIGDPWKRTECFLQVDGTYNWDKQSGQQWFMRQAKAYGVEQLLLFANSPPVYFTKNGKAYSDSGPEGNIPSDRYLAFGKFLADAAAHFNSNGLQVDYISPFNEPQWDWNNNKQEGSPYTNKEIYAITSLLDSVLRSRNTKTKIAIAEAGKLNYLYERADRETRGDQIFSFFDQRSDLYLGELPSVAQAISGHSYFTSHTEALARVRRNVQSAINKSSIPIEFWQSEYCLLGDREEIRPSGKDLGIDPALYVARIIHHDLAVANASAWHWWLAVSVYDHKDGLIYAEKNTDDGVVEDSKTLWALGNYSRFIRPGAQRLEVNSTSMDIDDPRGMMVSSYLNLDNELVVVGVNYSNSEARIELDINSRKSKKPKTFLTGPGDDEKLKPVDLSNGDHYVLPKRSVVTFVFSLK
jgi:O-glycosyl hydrolase